MPLERMPVYVRYGAQISVYSHVVQCTDQMDLGQANGLTFDDTYRGLSSSILGPVVGL